MIICQKVIATAHCVLESGKKCIAGEALLAQHDVKKQIPHILNLKYAVHLKNVFQHYICVCCSRKLSNWPSIGIQDAAFIL